MYVGIAVQCTWRNCTSTMLIHYVLLFNKFVAADCYQSQYCYRTLLLLYLHLKPKPICCYRIMGENGIIWPLKLCTPVTIDLQHCSINSRLYDWKKAGYLIMLCFAIIKPGPLLKPFLGQLRRKSPGSKNASVIEFTLFGFCAPWYLSFYQY